MTSFVTPLDKRIKVHDNVCDQRQRAVLSSINSVIVAIALSTASLICVYLGLIGPDAHAVLFKGSGTERTAIIVACAVEKHHPTDTSGACWRWALVKHACFTAGDVLASWTQAIPKERIIAVDVCTGPALAVVWEHIASIHIHPGTCHG
eukprot:m.1296032 g.1296032  ORF g.1296032 m.1296032 type:complete len:149 (+) comp24793_c1_seq5:711-1157(+)